MSILYSLKKNTFSNKKPVFYSGQNAKIDKKKKYLNKMIKCNELLVPPLLAIWNFGPQQPNPNPLPKKRASLISKTPFLSLWWNGLKYQLVCVSVCFLLSIKRNFSRWNGVGCKDNGGPLWSKSRSTQAPLFSII